jgi:hypothetical protein
VTVTQPECTDTSADPSFACTVQVSVTGTQLTANGVYNDGSSTIAPIATATLTPAAQQTLAGLIASFPLDVDDTIHSDGCGLAPTPATRWSIDFDNGEHRTFTYEYSDDPNVRALNDYVMRLAGQITECSGDAMTFDHCTPNVHSAAR